jgi:LPPG:FO 2-phospho-L-lactate transferase
VITVLCGGVGAARFLTGLCQVAPPASIAAVVNVGDDTEIFGLRICPDLDTITYTLSGSVNPETGWGLDHETFNVLQAVERLGGPTWFRLGDRDLATHCYRTGRLAEGASLSQLTAEIAAAFGLELALMPVSDDRLRTILTLSDGEVVSFQEYFVHRQHAVEVHGVDFEGAASARPAPAVLDSIAGAALVVIAPSNPVVSIGPILAVPAVREVLEQRRSTTVAISPIVAGAALKGPADRLLAELGFEASVVGVARYLRGVAGALVIDRLDEARAAEVEAEGLRAIVTETVMSTPDVAAALAATVLELAEEPLIGREPVGGDASHELVAPRGGSVRD